MHSIYMLLGHEMANVNYIEFIIYIINLHHFNFAPNITQM